MNSLLSSLFARAAGRGPIAMAAAILVFVPVAQAQFGPPQVLTSDVQDPRSIDTSDLDGDGDLDVLTASYSFSFGLSHGEIAWQENLGGGAFAPRIIIASGVSGAVCVYAADLDGDGDEDVLSAAAWLDTIAWYENLGGGTFGPGQTISYQAYWAKSVHAADVDSDGDLDVLSASCSDSKIAWYENLGSSTFGPQRIITTLATCAEDLDTADMDGDGDLDVISGSATDRKIAWYPNLGGGVFGFQQIISQDLSNPSCVQAVDLDEDGDFDVLASSIDDRTVAWFENLGGASFGPMDVIAGATRAYEVLATDLDGDGDADVMTIQLNGNRVAWHENRGGGDFGPRQQIAPVFSPRTLHAADLDDDGDPDVLVGHFQGELSLCENLKPIFGYCFPAAPNSTGLPGAITATGSEFAADNFLTLVASQLPADAFGFFMNSRTRDSVPAHGSGLGTLCLGGAIGRYVGPGEIQSSGPTGSFDLRLDLANTPTPTGPTAMQPGESWNFQCWYRDFDASTMTATSNLTAAVRVAIR